MDGDSSQRRRVSIGAGLGVVAWLFGYLLTYALAGSEVKNAGGVRLVEMVTGEEVAWKVVGWIFYNAHFVDTMVDAPLFGTDAVNFIAQSDGNAWVLYLLPPLLLLAVGALLATVAGRDSAEAGAKTGLSIVPGYFALAVVGALLFGVSSGETSAGPNLLVAGFLAGVVYPAVFGALGGAAGAVFTGEEAATDSAPTG